MELSVEWTSLIGRLPTDWQSLFIKLLEPMTGGEKAELWFVNHFSSTYGCHPNWLELINALLALEPYITTDGVLQFQSRFSTFPLSCQRNFLLFLRRHIPIIPLSCLDVFLKKITSPDCKDDWLKFLLKDLKLAVNKSSKENNHLVSKLASTNIFNNEEGHPDSSVLHQNQEVTENGPNIAGYSLSAPENLKLFNVIRDNLKTTRMSFKPWKHTFDIDVKQGDNSIPHQAAVDISEDKKEEKQHSKNTVLSSRSNLISDNSSSNSQGEIYETLQNTDLKSNSTPNLTNIQGTVDEKMNKKIVRVPIDEPDSMDDVYIIEPSNDEIKGEIPPSDDSDVNTPKTVDFLEPPPKKLKPDFDQDISFSQAEISFSQRLEPLTEAEWVQVEELRDTWHSASLDIKPPPQIEILCTASTLQVKEICQELKLDSLTEASLTTVCDHICNLGDQLSYSNCVHILTALLQSQVRAVNQTLPRSLLQVTVKVADHFPRQLIDSVVIPSLTDEETAPCQLELFSKLTREKFTDSTRTHLLQQIIEKVSLLSPGTVSLLLVLIDLKVVLQPSDLGNLTEKFKCESLDLCDNLKYGKLILAFLTKYGHQITLPQIEMLETIAAENKTFLKKSITTNIQKLKKTK